MGRLLKFLANRARPQNYWFCAQCLMPYRITGIEERYYANAGRPLPELCVRCRAEERRVSAECKVANE